MKQLYDVIPENLFSPLASKNKILYINGLFIVLEAFKQQLKIAKDELVSMMVANMELELLNADFADEELLENEYSLSGKAHFLIRKFKQTGWIVLETDADFKEYVTVPSYSIKIIKLLYELANPSREENFAFVYSTYSSLKTADETREPFEMVTALDDGANRTEKLVESLKSVYHSITYYYQQLIEFLSVNSVLRAHYENYQEEIIKRILSPLKIRDSVPKYKGPLIFILKKWLVTDGIIEDMASYMQSSSKMLSKEDCMQEIQRKIYYIIDTYENLENKYIRNIDEKNIRYTRATTQKIDYLVNSDQNLKGNLIQMLKMISNPQNETKAMELIGDSFEIYGQEFISEECLYARKRYTRRDYNSDLEMEDISEELLSKAKDNAKKAMQNKYSKQKVYEFIDTLLGDKKQLSSNEISVENDDEYIMTLLSVIYSKDKNSQYQVTFHEEYVQSGIYQLPLITFKRRA